MGYPYYAIVTYGSPSFGQCKAYYRSFGNAWRDARTLGGGTLRDIRIVGTRSRREAINADIGDEDVAVVAHV